MNDTATIVLYASAAGAPIFIGGLISRLVQGINYKLKDLVNHSIIAFSGGALLSAIAFVLIPKGVEEFNILPMTLLFLGGTLAFLCMDVLSSKLGGSLAQVLSMMMDFIPEALALGASFAYDHSFGLLMAIFIGVQNLPEGYNSYLEINERLSSKKTLCILFALSFVGILSALLGEFVLSDQGKVVDGIMLFAGGGILYLIFQDIAPTTKIDKHYYPATGASLGFLVGMIGEKLIG